MPRGQETSAGAPPAWPPCLLKTRLGVGGTMSDKLPSMPDLDASAPALAADQVAIHQGLAQPATQSVNPSVHMIYDRA